METGNPKHVAILAVVAVGAVGYLVTHMGGKGAPTTVAATPSAPKAATRAPSVVVVVRDPFSHPKLAPPPVKVAVPAGDPKLAFSIAGPPSLGGRLPSVGPLLPEAPAGAERVAVRPLAAVEPKAPAKPAPVPTTLVLEGVAGASDVVAFLSVAGAESQPYRPGDRIAGAVRLLRVEDGAVVVSGPHGELTLEVGERKTI